VRVRRPRCRQSTKFAKHAKHIAQIDIDASEINKVKNVQWHHIGLLPEALHALMSHGRRTRFTRDWSAWLKHCADLKAAHPMNYDRASPLIQPYYVIEEIKAVDGWRGDHRDGRRPAPDVGCASTSTSRARGCGSRSGSMGTMGFGLPAAIGAKFAHPERLVIDLDGDGSIRMNLGELETVTTYDLAVKVVLLNNFGDGMVRQWQKLFYKGRMSASDKSLHKKDFVKAAQADGFRFAVRLDRKEDVPRVVKEFIEFQGPAFLEVMIDPDAGVLSDGRPGPRPMTP